MQQVMDRQQAEAAHDAGADVIIAQGGEAGGHGGWVSTGGQGLWAGRWPAPARVAAGALACFALATLLAAALHPGYDPVAEGISALAATDSPSAPEMIIGFLVLAIGTITAGVTLWVHLRTGVAGRVGAALVVLAGVGMTVAGPAQQDCSELIGACAAAEEAGTLSAHHMLHQLTSLAVFTLLTVAFFVLPRGLAAAGWGHLRIPTRLAGVGALLCVLAMVTIGFGAAAGLVQRVFILVLFGWPVLLAAVPADTAPLGRVL